MLGDDAGEVGMCGLMDSTKTVLVDARTVLYFTTSTKEDLLNFCFNKNKNPAAKTIKNGDREIKGCYNKNSRN